MPFLDVCAGSAGRVRIENDFVATWSCFFLLVRGKK